MSTIELTSTQQKALAGESTAYVTDPSTRKRYVLIPADEYEAIRDTIEEERQRAAIARLAARNAVGRMDE